VSPLFNLLVMYGFAWELTLLRLKIEVIKSSCFLSSTVFQHYIRLCDLKTNLCMKDTELTR